MQTVRRHDHVPPQADIGRWRQAISAGNQAFQNEEFLPALEHYATALAWAIAMYGHGDDAHAGTAAVVIAHHNLADTYARLDRADEQGRHVCAAHERLLAAIDDEAMKPVWREVALGHSRRTFAELVRFLADHPDDQRAAAMHARSLGLRPAGRSH
ncbi:MAG: hypothetical protein QM766_21980 [Burkholderiaceae bacterium]